MKLDRDPLRESTGSSRSYRCRDAAQTRWFSEDVIAAGAAGLVLDPVPGERMPQISYAYLFRAGGREITLPF